MTNGSETPEVPEAPTTPAWVHPPASHHRPYKRSFASRFFRKLFILLFILSVMANLFLLAAITAELVPGLDTATIRQGAANQQIAVYAVEGLIDGRAARNFASFRTAVADDPNVKAVVLRVVSPGGGMGPSDRIHSMVKSLKAAGKTVVVSMGDIAASGGYYIAAPADEIIAEPTTMTGSIGVIAGWLIIRETLEKIGAEAIVLKSTQSRGWKDEISPLVRPDARQLAHIQEILDTMQERFNTVVKNGRGDRLVLRPVDPYTIKANPGEGAEHIWIRDEVEPLNGKAYHATAALELGLIDAIGYESKAIDRAAELAGLDRPRVVQYQTRRSPLARLLGAQARVPLLLDRRTLDELQTPRIQVIWKVE